MFVKPNDLMSLEGNGGDLFEGLLYDLVVAEGRVCYISPSEIEYDHRVNIGDGGCDIKIKVGHSATRSFLPQVPSIWSAKAGKNGIQVPTLKKELEHPSHTAILELMKRGGKFVWCVLKDCDQLGKDKMHVAARKLEAELQLPDNSIEFRWNESLTTFLNDHPNLIARHFPDIARAFKCAHFFKDWEQSVRSEFDSPWVDFDARGLLMTRIHDHLISRKGPNVLHIAGLSGIGKTRTVFETCRVNEELRGVLYIPDLQSLTIELKRYLKNPGRVAMVVIDEVSLNKLDAFIGEFEDFTDRLRFATLGPAPRGESRRPSDPNILLLSEPKTTTGVLQVVRCAGQGIPDPVLESIAEMSAHDLRLALLLVKATKRSPQYRETPIIDVSEIWQRIMSLFVSEIGDVNRFRNHYEALSMFIDVGRDGEFRSELDYLAKYRQFKHMEIDRSIEEASRCGLGEKTPSFFEPGPRALAVQIFQYYVWPSMQLNLPDFLREMPTERLRRRFIERCQECSGSVRKEAERELERFFQDDLGEAEILSLADRDRSRVFQAWAELDPKSGLRWLKRAIFQASREDIEALDGFSYGVGGWHARRHIVWTCENLACFAEHFFDCEEILFKLAQVETETSIANNSLETWRALFRIVLSFTEVPFPERLEFLLGRLRKASFLELPLVLSASLGIFSMKVGRCAPPRVIGGRIVPEEWRPGTNEEGLSLTRHAASRVLTCISELDDGERKLGAEAVLGYVNEFISIGAASDLRKFFEGEMRDERVRRSLVAQLHDQLGRYRMLAEQDNDNYLPLIEELDQWMTSLASDDLATQIKDLTAQDYWSIAVCDRRNKLSSIPDIYFDDLAKKAICYPEVLSDLADWLSSPEAKSSVYFGFALGKTDTGDSIDSIVYNWLSEGRSHDFVLGYLDGLRISQQGLTEIWSKRLDEIATKYPLYVALASLKADVSRNGFRRIMKIMPILTAHSSRIFSRFAVGHWRNVLVDDDMAEILLALQHRAEGGETEACQVAFELLNLWTNRGGDQTKEPTENPVLRAHSLILQPASDSMIEPIYRLAAIAQQRSVQIDDFDFEIAIRLLANDRPEQSAELLVQSLTDMPNHSLTRRESSVQVLSDLAQCHPASVMEAVGSAIMDQRRRIYFGLMVFRGLFESIGMETVQPWVKEHGEESAVWIARHLQSPGVDEKSVPFIPPLTEWFMTEFEHSDQVFNAFCAGRHSGEVHWGDPSDRTINIEASVAPFHHHPLRRVREWVQYELEEHRHEIQFQRWFNDRSERR